MREPIDHIVRVGRGYYSARGGFCGRIVGQESSATRFTAAEAVRVAGNITAGSRRITTERITTASQETSHV